MMKYLSNSNQGLVIVADQQSKGVGRGTNEWKSPIGCLLTSFKCKETDGSKLPFLQYIVGMSMVEAIKSFPDSADVDILLKWPNDIYGSSKIHSDEINTKNWKLGDVLCQSNFIDKQFNVVVGVGLNVTNTDNPSITLNQMIQKSKNGSPSVDVWTFFF